MVYTIIDIRYQKPINHALVKARYLHTTNGNYLERKFALFDRGDRNISIHFNLPMHIHYWFRPLFDMVRHFNCYDITHADIHTRTPPLFPIDIIDDYIYLLEMLEAFGFELDSGIVARTHNLPKARKIFNKFYGKDIFDIYFSFCSHLEPTVPYHVFEEHLVEKVPAFIIANDTPYIIMPNAPYLFSRFLVIDNPPVLDPAGFLAFMRREPVNEAMYEYLMERKPNTMEAKFILKEMINNNG